jgi:hypothetical protein
MTSQLKRAQLERSTVSCGNAGGYGERAVYSTTRVSSADVSVLRVQRESEDASAFDFGHGDLLFATSARELVWTPLANWLSDH